MTRPAFTAAEDRATYQFLEALERGEASVPGHPAGESRGVAGEELWFPPTTLAGVPVTPETALTLTAAFSCINVLATDSACLDLSAYRHRKDGGKELAADCPIHELLHTTPDGRTTAVNFRQALLGHTLGRGNGYARIYRRGNGWAYELRLLDPKTTRPIRLGNGTVAYSTDGGNEIIPADDVIHVAGLGFDGLQGYSPVHMARQAIALGLAAEAFGATFFGNGTRPSGFLKTARKLKPEAVANLRDSLGAIHQGPYNAHKLAVLEEGMEWVQTSVNPEDAQFLATRQFQVIEVCRMYRVPPHKVMDYSQAHLANVEESNLDYLMTSLLPWLVIQEAQFNLKLFTAAQRREFFVEHSMDTLLRGNMVAMAQYFKELFAMGVFSINDICRRLRLNPIGPDGDKRFVPLNMVTVDQAGKTPPTPPAARSEAPADAPHPIA
jgi:HK97 family phage portal protein